MCKVPAELNGGELIERTTERHMRRPTPSYTATGITSPGSTDTLSLTINHGDDVAGGYTDRIGEHSFIYDDDRFTTLSVPGATCLI
jgi:hypothetical protein